MTLATFVIADEWHIKRNPFTVSEAYIKQTKQVYLEPKNNYIPFEIDLIGIVYTKERKEAIVEIEFEGVNTVKLNETIKVNTPDIESYLKVVEISSYYVIVSLNGGEGIKYEIK